MKFAIIGPYITLGQLIKAQGVLQSGSDVKIYIAEEDVKINGEPENRRGRKLYPGDVADLPGIGHIEMEQNAPDDV